ARGSGRRGRAVEEPADDPVRHLVVLTAADAVDEGVRQAQADEEREGQRSRANSPTGMQEPRPRTCELARLDRQTLERAIAGKQLQVPIDPADEEFLSVWRVEPPDPVGCLDQVVS